MAIQTSTRLGKTLITLAAGLLILPVMVACGSQTAQESRETTSVQPSPELNESPNTAVSPTVSPTTGAATTSDRNIADVAASNSSLSTLRTVIQEAGLTETLQGQGPYTVFAPSNEAFAAIPEATRQQLLRPENREKLQRILAYHVVPRTLSADQLQAGGNLDTVAGQPLTIQANPGTQQVRVNNASVVQPNIQASNGVIHIVDQVIIPPDVVL